ncbi:hypothetical protein C2S52_018639 [Perilla frutescens var. hirtella]|nr:hypothetical protein C2S52_018639 [Perilla frutescens var. hirtella]
MKAENEAAYLNFLEREPRKFCKAFVSTVSLCDMVDNNISETFNGYIVQARGKPLIHMLNDIRTQLMNRQYTKVAAIAGVTDRICPTIRARIEKLKYESRHGITIPALHNKYEVHLHDDQFLVNMSNKTCTCRAWDLSGIPCIHACAAMSFLKVDATDFVADYYTVNHYIEAYRSGIEPLNSMSMWPDAIGYPVLPPLLRKMPGRPKKKRTRAPEEKEDKNPTKLKRGSHTRVRGDVEGMGVDRGTQESRS